MVAGGSVDVVAAIGAAVVVPVSRNPCTAGRSVVFSLAASAETIPNPMITPTEGTVIFAHSGHELHPVLPVGGFVVVTPRTQDQSKRVLAVQQPERACSW